MKTPMTCLLLICAISGFAQDVIPTTEIQISTAVLAAPADKRAGAMVYGYDPAGVWTVLRNGTNELICLADDPHQNGFSVSCYHKDLDAFMARGRELKRMGKSQKEIFDIREQDVKAGKIVMPPNTTLYVYYTEEKNYNKTTGVVTHGNFRYVVYIPYATAESTGLPTKPEAPGMPWIMDPGTHRAHIMINPPAGPQD